MNEQGELKAIETRYKGFRFRSRLEARWGVALEAMSLQWSYEQQGFQLPSGWYLPDFFVGSWSAFVEIKARGRIFAESVAKCGELSDASGKTVLLIAGDPWPHEYEVILFTPGDPLLTGCQLRWCEVCGAIWASTEVIGGYHGALLGRSSADTPVHACRARQTGLLIEAFAAARGARFGTGD